MDSSIDSHRNRLSSKRILLNVVKQDFTHFVPLGLPSAQLYGTIELKLKLTWEVCLMSDWLQVLLDRSEDRTLVNEADGFATVNVKWYKNKNKPTEVSGSVDVEIPTSVEAAIEEYGEDYVCSVIAQYRMQSATNKARAGVDDPEKAQKKAEATVSKLKQLADQLGVSLEDLLNS